MTENFNLLCQEKHRNIDSRLDGHDRHFTEVDLDVDALKISRAQSDTMMTNVCKKIDSLITVLITGILAIFGATLSFIIWYVQSLPR